MVQRVSSPVFVGRVQELERTRALMKRALEAGEGATILVAGEAGVGKTRFVREIANDARESGWTVLHGTCDEFGAEARPFAALRGMLDAIEAFLAAHAPGELERPAWRTLVQLRELPTSTRVGGSVVELASGLFQRMTAVKPVMVVVDDLHWADESTRGLFETISRILSGSVAVVIGSYRANEVTRGHPLRQVLGTLHRLVRPETLELPPFDEGEVQDVVHTIGRSQRGDARELWERSGGNAFLLEELLASPRGVVPNGVRDVVLARLDALSVEAVQVAEFASLDTTVSVEVLAEVVMLGPVGLASALDVLIAHGFLVAQGREYRFRHPLLREAIYDGISPARRPVMHAAMARGLVQCEPNRQGEIARHWHEAGDGEKEFVALLEAGGAAQRIGAITEAGDFFQRALALWDELPEPAGLFAWQWPRLVEETSALLIQSRRFQAAYRLTQRALEQRRQFGAGDQCRLLSAAGEAMFYNDAEPLTDLRAVFAFFQGAVEHLDESVEPKTAISLLSRFGTHAMQQGRDEEGLRAIERAVRMARASDNSRLLWFAHLWRAIWRARAGDAGAEDDLVEVASIRRRLGETLPVVGIAAAHDYLGQAQAALRVGLSASEWCVEHGQAGVRGYQVEELIGRSLERLGRFDQVIERYEKLCERIGRDQVEGWPDMEMMAFGIAFARSGQTAEAAAIAQRASRWIVPTHEVWMMGAFARLRVDLARANGDIHAARAALAEVLPHVQEASLATCGEAISFSIGLEADAGHLHGTKSDALALADAWIAQLAGELTEHPARARFEDLAMFIEQAELERARLAGEDNPERWEDMAARWEAVPRPYHAAYTRYRAAFALVTTHGVAMNGSRGRAGELLRLAFAACRTMGAQPLEADIVRLARSAGIRLSNVETVAERTHPVASGPVLTEREFDVLRLLVEGDSNGQIAIRLGISTKTASVHVSNILHKLEAKNRVEAAMRATRLGIVAASRL